MNILAFAEQRQGTFKNVAFEITKAARNLADQLGAELTTLVVGDNVSNIASQLGGFGATKVLVVEDSRLGLYSTTAYTKIVADIARRVDARIVILPATQMGKDLAPRLSVRLEGGLAPDCVALKVEAGEIVATRPAYSGKVLIDLRISTPVKLFTLRPNVFTAGSSNGQVAEIEKIPFDLADGDFKSKVLHTKVVEGRPDVTEAAIVISGGRGLKAPENFGLLEQLADLLGGAVGASRAVVDSGWRPHDEQVGQTGKTVSPTLYIACGISGAIQHLAGMSSSKYIVAINKDKDAPIFQISDYGIVADVLEILPALTAEVKKLTGR